MTKEINTSKLRRYNIIAGVFHLIQMIAVLALANDFTLPIVARYMSGPPGSTFAEPITLLDTPVGLGVALFLGLSAFFHFLVASPQFFPRYSAGLTQNRNYFRWVEYSISSSVMIVLIAQICGVSDVVAWLASGKVRDTWQRRLDPIYLWLHRRDRSLVSSCFLCFLNRRTIRGKCTSICLRNRLFTLRTFQYLRPRSVLAIQEGRKVV
ncbi:MAG: hypothetical protein RJA96_1070 [Actinomycetota bacterium]